MNGAGGAARSTQPVTLYITVNVTPPNPYNSSPSIPTEYIISPAEEATILPAPEHPRLLPLSHHQPVETGNTMPHSREEAREEVSHTSTKDPLLALDGADEAMTRIVPMKAWEGALEKIKWAMSTLSPVAEVRIIFHVLG